MSKKLIYAIILLEIFGLFTFAIGFDVVGALILIALIIVITVLAIRDKQMANKNGFADSNLKIRLYRAFSRDSLLLYMAIGAITSGSGYKSPLVRILITIISGLLAYWVSKYAYRIYHDDFLNFSDHYPSGSTQEPKGKVQINFEHVPGKELHKITFDDGSFVLVDKKYQSVGG